jgi:flagellar motor switch protein FliN/FliY
MPERVMDFLKDIPVEVVVELGRARMTIRRLASLEPDDVIELDHGQSEPVNLVVGGRLIARGETVVRKDRVALRIVEIVVGESEGEPR